MVKNSGTASRAHDLRPLNQPRMIRVVVEAGKPVALIDKRGGRMDIVHIEETWRIDDEWWREPVQRHYYRVMLASGSALTIYRDVPAGIWYEQRY